MQLSDIPSKFNIPFASSAGGSYINAIPQNPSGTPGKAALTTGFPPENFSPVAAGGVPPYGSDFNGVFNQVTAWNRWQATGRSFPPYDATFQTAVGGYPRGSIVESLVATNLFYYSIVDNNVTNPDAGGAGWIVFWRQLLNNTNLYVDTVAGNDANSGLSPAAAKKTIGAAITTAWTFTPNPTFGVTINIATGTYNESVLTPLFAGSAITIDGGVAANVIINTTTGGNCITVQGPNTMVVKNVTVQSSGGIRNGFAATNGASLTTLNTRSNALSGAVFAASASGNCAPGAHTMLGSAQALFSAQANGTINCPDLTNYTIANAVTMSVATAYAFLLGVINMPIGNPVSFTNPGNVTGPRFSASANAVIFASGLGASFFPGTVAGSTSMGGQSIT